MSIIPDTSVLDKWKTKKSASMAMARKLYKAAEYYPVPEVMRGRAARMATCSTMLEYQYCADCGSLHLARTNLCRDRLCPLCSWRLSLQRTGEMLHVLERLHDNGLEAPCAMLTLTMRNCKVDDLGASLRRLLDAWRLLTKRRCFTAWVIGSARSIELTRGRNGTLHPHIHALLFFKDGYNGRIAQREWSALWRECLGVDYVPIVDIRMAYSKRDTLTQDAWTSIQAATLEACKYAVKGDLAISLNAEETAAVALALTGVRLVAYSGIIRQARKELRYRDADAAADVSAVTIECPKCGSATMVSLVYTWGTNSYVLSPFCRSEGDYVTLSDAIAFTQNPS